MSFSLPEIFVCILLRRNTYLLLLTVLFVTAIAQASPPIQTPTESKPTSADACLDITIEVQGEERPLDLYCLNETVTLVAAYTGKPLPASLQPSSGQARKASSHITYLWLAPAGASLSSYTSEQVTASFTTSGPKTFTVTVINDGCSGTDEITITANPAPDITIFFPNSQTLVPISNGLPTVTQITLPNTLQATQGVLYEWSVAIDRINGYEIRSVATNTTGIFPVGAVGPYTLTVTAANGCKRTLRGILVQKTGQ